MYKAMRNSFLVLVALLVAALLYFDLHGRLRESSKAFAAAPSTGRFVRLHDQDMFIQIEGPVGGQPILFTHAAGAWSETWMPTMRRLAERGYMAIAVDLAPCGYSSRPENGDYSRMAQALRIKRLVEVLNLQKLVIVGHSFGGKAAVTAARLMPERMDKLVLADVAMGWSADERADLPKPNALLNRVLSFYPFAHVLASIATYPGFTRGLVGSFVLHPEKLSDDIIEVYRRPLYLEQKTQMIAEWLPEFLSPKEFDLVTDPAALGGLTFPTLVLWGEQDSVTPLWQGRKLAAQMPRAKLHILKEVNHLPRIEAPDEFQGALLDFLAARD